MLSLFPFWNLWHSWLQVKRTFCGQTERRSAVCDTMRKLCVGCSVSDNGLSSCLKRRRFKWFNPHHTAHECLQFKSSVCRYFTQRTSVRRLSRKRDNGTNPYKSAPVFVESLVKPPPSPLACQWVYGECQLSSQAGLESAALAASSVQLRSRPYPRPFCGTFTHRDTPVDLWGSPVVWLTDLSVVNMSRNAESSHFMGNLSITK